MRDKCQNARLERWRLGSVCAVLLAGFFVLAARLVWIQGVRHDFWVARARSHQERRQTVFAERGMIRDRNGSILAMNAEAWSIFVRPTEVRHPEEVARRLAPIANPRRVLKQLHTKKPFVYIARETDEDFAEEVSRSPLSGIGVESESGRYYPKRLLSGQVIGVASVDNNGLEGVELRHDARLRGQDDRRIVQRDARGRSVFPKNFEYMPAPHGDDIVLAIDEVIQYVSERELGVAIETSGAKGGVAIVMNPHNGEVLAMATLPRVNPNAVTRQRPGDRRNRAITDLYEPGSTFKIVTAAAALAADVVYPEEWIDCEQGSYRVPGAGRTLLHDHDPIGVVPFRQVVAQSSNIGMAKIAQRLGPARLAESIRAFGFGERLGIDLEGERAGQVHDRARWSGRSLVSIAIGQEIGVTPLQMASAMSVIANGGWLMSPRIALSVPCVTTACSETELDRDPMPLRRVLTTEVSQQMTRILKEAVSDGTGANARIPGYSVAGKTGTAQKIDPATGRYFPDRAVSSFVGFVPAERPAVVILVVIDEVPGHGWGGKVAAPVFSAIGAEVLHYLRIPPDPTVADSPVNGNESASAARRGV